MSEIRRLTNQMDRAFFGEAWHGPAVMELLSELSAETAAARPIESAHTIWEITNHIRVWKEIATLRLNGTPKQVEVGSAQDWPPAPGPSPDHWKEALEALNGAHERLKKCIINWNDTRLAGDAPYNKTEDYNYTLVQGIIQHDLYHAGQIALLKKLVS